jgi:hypothetical protein
MTDIGEAGCSAAATVAASAPAPTSTAWVEVGVESLTIRAGLVGSPCAARSTCYGIVITSI